MPPLKVMLAVVLGFPLLLIPCAFGRWTEPNYPSIKPWPSGIVGVGPYRPLVRQWSWRWLNWWYANTEDGVSGQEAWIWGDNGQLIPYMLTAPAWWRAYCWNARNNANNIKRPLRKDSLNKAWP